MAVNTSQKQLELEKKRLEILQSQLKAVEQLNDAQKEELVNIEKAIKKTDKKITQAKEKAKYQQLENKEFESFAKKFKQMSQDVQKQLKGTSTQATVYLSLGREISKDKAIQLKFADSTKKREQQLLANAQERESVFTDISTELATQAKETQKAQDELQGISDIERQIKDIKESTGVYSAVQKKQLIDALNQTEALGLKEERLKTIKEEQAGLFQALPDSIQSAVGFAKKLRGALTAGALPIVLLSSLALVVLSSFKSLDDAAKEFRTETGLTNSQMEGIKSQANDIVGSFANLGVEAKDVFDTVAKLKSEFSDTVGFSDEVVAGLTVLSKNFGVSAENAAKVQGVLENVGGLSAETATSVQLQVANMSKLAGVAPAKVFEDMAGSAEIASTLFRGNIESFAKATVEARRLGTTISKMGETAKGLLDFESGITEELTAAAMLGGDFNLTRARSLAYTGDLVGMQNEILDQVQKTGDFSKKDLFTQEQIAKATGISVEEINKQLNVREKLKSLSSEEQKLAEQAMAAGLDLSNIKKEDLATQVAAFSKQQEQQAVLDQISNQFMGIAATVGSALVPLLEVIAPILELAITPLTMMGKIISSLFSAISAPFMMMVDIISEIGSGIGKFVNYLAESLPFMSALVAGATTYLFLKNQALIASKAETALALVRTGYEVTLNGIKAAGALIQKKGLLGAIAEMAMRAFSAVASIPFIGPVLGIAAAAGALALGYQYYSKAGDLESPADGKTRISTKEGGLFELSPRDDVAAAPGLIDAMGGNPSLGEITKRDGVSEAATPSVSVDLSGLIAEMKGLRSDLSSGKIGVNMDGKKVTAAVGRVVGKDGTNSYGL